ncbi:helix-turn-helix domain-containing protein [Aeromicrobium endophyticum]|uniref:PucR family transcriptional regulator n=1 Tax=Aeromicrobium endophyticum TaxID=2292704 RepID=A0A371PA45_9ACTN|nr:helix-turn-helix domain-containing protein [Aeromicrobium endophyticum]REK72809.1 PucR family transcriptional regulator [Aeromicrobium endophyticum]
MGDEGAWLRSLVGDVTDRTPPGRPMSVQDHARALRPLVAAFATDVADRIQTDVPAYAGEPDGRRRDVIAHAVEQATHRFLDTLDGLPHRDRGVDEMFQAMGRAEASDSGDLAAMRAALRLAATVTWDNLRRANPEQPLTDETRGQLADGLFGYIDHLVEQAEKGFAAGRRAIQNDRGQARARLADKLLTGRHRGPLDAVDPQVWAPPEWVVVVVSEPDEQRSIDVATLALDHLVVRHDQRVAVIADAKQTLAVTAAFEAAGTRAAVSWPVGPKLVPSAYRWARRALDLVRRGVIPEQPLIECRDHRTQIWLHSEPALRQRMCQDMLKPLLAETPNSREILSQTLLVWLETRDSAPAIAAHLGVHAQTVRYRWKRINELFGDDLHDPEFIVQITMLLKASVPLWQAGDQSDFERFREEESA